MKLMIIFSWISLLILLNWHTSIRSTFFAFIFWYLSERYALESSPSPSYAVIVSLFIVTMTIIYIYVNWEPIKTITKIMYFVVITFFCVYSAYLVTYSSMFGKISYEQMFAIMQTNTSEAYSYSKIITTSPIFLLMISLMLVIMIIQSRIDKRFFYKLAIRGKNRFILIFLIFLPAISFSEQSTKGFVPVFLSARNDYIASIEQMKLLRAQRKNNTIRTSHNIKDNSVHVLVIGESVNKFHMSQFGYFRPTTPWLDNSTSRGESLVFTNAFANHTHTMLAVPYMLSKLNLSHPGNVLHEETIINTAHHLGYKTYWISNQQKEGVWDNVVGLLSEEADKSIFINTGKGMSSKTSYLDGELIKYFSGVMNEPGAKFIILHLMGSHGDYCDRVPKNLFLDNSIKKFPSQMMANRVKDMDCYDKSILYTDQILASIVSKLKQANIPATMTYIPDHGEDVFGGKYHDSSSEIKMGMVSIPMVVWGSKQYRKDNNRITTLVKHRDNYFTNDYIYDLIFYLLSGVKNTMFLPSKDSVKLRHGESTLSDIKEITPEEKQYYSGLRSDH